MLSVERIIGRNLDGCTVRMLQIFTLALAVWRAALDDGVVEPSGLRG